jgi:hypothetical protein
MKRSKFCENCTHYVVIVREMKISRERKRQREREGLRTEKAEN